VDHWVTTSDSTNQQSNQIQETSTGNGDEFLSLFVAGEDLPLVGFLSLVIEVALIFFAFQVFSQSAFPPPSMPPPPQLEYFYGNHGIMAQVVHVPRAPAVSHLFYFQKMKSLTYNSLKAPICPP
jgi:hypothetical protein